jgi:hypothetical protein
MDKDKDFVIEIIQYLQNKYEIIFFITPKDFDVLYNWWEKRIPLRIVKESITNVVERWKEKGKIITGFANFRYEVKKVFQAFLQLSVGSEKSEKEIQTPEEKDPFSEINHFFNNYPPPLNPLEEEFHDIYQKIKKNESVDVELTRTHETFVNLFKDDKELNLKVRIFLDNLSPVLRKPEIEQRYRLNYLINKFKIPDFSPMAWGTDKALRAS